MIIDRKIDNVVGNKSARACDSCIRRRAHWYCTADDAFLCQGCDTTVHSANQLASWHERVRLGTSNFIKDCQNQDSAILSPAWHQWFTKKARTRRRANNKKSNNLAVLHEAKNEEKSLFASSLPLVPEISSEETSSSSPFDENHQEAGLISSYQVPVFDLFYEHGEIGDLGRFLLPSEMELAEFAADMESLLGGDIKKNYNAQEKDGMHNFDQCENGQEKGGTRHFCHGQGERVLKIEEKDDDEGENIEAMLACQFTFDWNFDYDEEFQINGEDEKAVMIANKDEMKVEMGNNLCLKLNFDEVISSWPNQKSPWTTGTRPDLNADEPWTDIMGISSTNFHHENGLTEGVIGQVGSGDGARKARVSRYREKRRTRMFSKKIRYEVRKLNAEKRPRMRGRFVKRTSFAVLASAGLPQHI